MRLPKHFCPIVDGMTLPICALCYYILHYIIGLHWIKWIYRWIKRLQLLDKIYSIEEQEDYISKELLNGIFLCLQNLSESCLSDLQIDTNSHLDSIAVQCLHIFLTIQVILVLWDNLK